MDNTIKNNLEGAISYIEDLEKQIKEKSSRIKILNKNLSLVREDRNKLRSEIRSQYHHQYQNINDIDLRKIDFAYSGLLEGKVYTELLPNLEGERLIFEETFDNYNAILRYLNISSYNVDANTAMKKIKEYSNTTDHKEITLKIKHSSGYTMYFKNYQ
jgi:predicted nuclease with TOPRIM domain